jgi:hypothetical protein
MDNSKFKLTKEGIEISGSEEFVESQLLAFKGLIEKSFEKILDGYSMPNALLSTTPKAANLPVTEETEFIEVDQSHLNYEDVFAISGDTVRIIADIPGNSQAKRMINVILLYLWVRQRQGQETATFSEIREFCKLQGEFDGANFSKHVESQKKYFLLSSDSKNKTVRLIRPGVKEAERLLKDLSSSIK